MRHEKRILILLAISLAITLAMSYCLREAIAQISKTYIEFLIGLSITMAGFGLVAFQIGKSSDELKKDFIESSILMILSALTAIVFWVYPSRTIWAISSSILFLWGIILLLVVLLSERFDIIK